MVLPDSVISCQISFSPIESADYVSEIKLVIDIIDKSGLENTVGIMSTTIRGAKARIFRLLEKIFDTMENRCSFIMDIKLSNLCGCR